VQRIEGERVADLDRKFAVEQEALDRERAQERDDVREIAPERLARFGAEIDRVAGAGGETAEPVPFRLELPARAVRQRVHELRFHRLDLDRDGE
jgi:hypothetical protein